MSVKLVDLQLIYGVAGARDQFENLCAQLIRSVHPTADKVRVSRGDGGIDAYCGDLAAKDVAEVFQCKFFPQGLDDSQKKQIRESFTTCRKQVNPQRWTLCLPVDLSREEKDWFATFRQNQASHGVEISEPWAATHLEGLLYQAQNKGILETYFKQEHLSQIRELHSALTKLLPDIATRLQQDAADRDAGRRAAVQARQAEIAEEFLHATRDRYIEAATAASDGQRRPDHWEVMIRPSDTNPAGEIETLKKCSAIAEKCKVVSHGWDYPEIPYERERGTDWVGATHPPGQVQLETWRLSQRGIFAHLFPIFDDYQGAESKSTRLPRQSPDGFIPRQFLDVGAAVRMITHVFRFAANLVEQPDYPGKTGVDVLIRITGTTDRVLSETELRVLHDRCRATISPMEKTWTCTPDQLANADELAVKAAMWFFERFNWDDATEDTVKAVQTHIFSRFPRRR